MRQELFYQRDEDSFTSVPDKYSQVVSNMSSTAKTEIFPVPVLNHPLRK